MIDVATVPESDGRGPEVEGPARRAVQDDDPTRPSTAPELHVALG